MNKEKQIKEMARLIFDFDEVENNEMKIAKWLYDNGYRKITENEVVISKEEKQKLLKEMYEQGKFDAIADLEKEGKVVIGKEEYEKITKELVTEQRAKEIAQEFFGIVRKETAREILNDIGNHLKKYAHIHKYAEKANKTEEEYADGTPVELNSVWEVLSLHKNGYDTYETMCELEDNIRNIALSRLLIEFEKDFKLYAKQFGVEIGEEK